METLSEEAFTTRTGYIRTRIYHNSFVVAEECTTIAVAGLSNPLLSESFGDTLTIAIQPKGWKKDFLRLCNNFPGLNVR